MKTYMKAIVAFIGGAATYASTLGLPHPWDYIVGGLLFAGTVAGVWGAKNAPANTSTGS